MNKLYKSDFNVSISNSNGEFVKISKINKMIECGAIKIDEQKLKEYKAKTRFVVMR